MVLTLDLFRTESSFTTASCQRGERLSLHVQTHWYSCFSLHCSSVSLSCSSCTSWFNCNWCPVEFQCRTSGAECSQSPVVSVHAALVQCYVFALWSISKARPPTIISSPPPPQFTSSSFPRLLPALTGNGRYYLHEGLGPQDESLVLRGENLLMAVSNHCYYDCISKITHTCT